MQDAQQQTRTKNYKQPKILDWIQANPMGHAITGHWWEFHVSNSTKP
jgi:hypothetical protein